MPDERTTPSVVERAVAAVERHPARTVTWGAVAALVSLFSAFIGGFTCHKDLVESSGMDTVPRGTYILRSELSAYVPKQDLYDNFLSKDAVNREYIPRSALASDYILKSDCVGTVNPITSSTDPASVSTSAQGDQVAVTPAPLIQEEQGFSFELHKCGRSGTTVTCQFSVTNTQEQQRGIELWAFGREGSSRIIDDAGTQYYATQATLAGITEDSPALRVPAQVKVRLSIRFPGIPADSNSLSILQVSFSDWSNTYAVEFRRIRVAA